MSIAKLLIFLLQNFDKLIFSASDTELCGRLNGSYTVSALDALDEMRLAGIGAGINEVNAGLIDCHGIIRNENADVGNAGILGYSTTVAVNAHILHYVDIENTSAEVIYNRACCIRHRIKEGVVLGRPDVLGLACTVDISLSEG